MNTICEYDNVWAYPKGLEQTIRKLLTYKPQGYVHSPAYKGGWWDGTKCLLEIVDKKGHPVSHERYDEETDTLRFPAGLLPYVQAHVGDRLDVWDLRIRPHASPWRKVLPGQEPDEVQAEAIAALLKVGRGALHYPTGIGKTRMMGNAIREAGLQTLVLCNTKVLLSQLHHELSVITGVDVGIWGDGKAQLGADIVVGTIQTIDSQKDLPAAKDYLSKVQFVAIDEAHHLVAPTYGAVMQRLTSAYFRAAFSATVHKSRNAAGAADRAAYLYVTGWTGEVVGSETKAEAVDRGRLVPAKIFIVGYGHHQDDDDDVDADYGRGNSTGWQNNDYKAQQLPSGRWLPPKRNFKMDIDEYLVHDEARNQTIIKVAAGMARRKQHTVILIEREAHGHLLQEALLEEGKRAPFLFGGTPQAERERVFQRFRDGKEKLIIVSKIGDEGLDLPNVNCLILAGAGRAAHRQVQRIGRGLRVSDGKTHLNVFDFADRGKYLSAQYRRRRRTYEVEPIFSVIDITAEQLESWVDSADPGKVA